MKVKPEWRAYGLACPWLRFIILGGVDGMAEIHTLTRNIQ